MTNRFLSALCAASMLTLSAAPALAQDRGWHGDRGDYREGGRDGRYDGRHDNGNHYGQRRYGNGNGYAGSYDPQRQYRQGNYGERRLSRNDRVYRGRDGRYYCKRSNGTTGLVIGGVGGGVLGNLIAPGGSKTLGTLLGAGGGALLGRSVDRNNVKCR